MSSKNNSDAVFECIKCKKFDRGDKEILKGYCYLCRVHDLKTRYTKRKLENYNKFELKQELKRLTKKKRDEFTDSEEYSDELSCSDNLEDEDFIPSSLPKEQKKKMKSCVEPPPVKRRLLVSNTPTPPKTSNTIQNSPHKIKKKQTKSDSGNERTDSEDQETQKTGSIENKNKQKKLVKKVKKKDSRLQLESGKTIRKNWKGQVNYYPGLPFQMFQPENISDEQEIDIWNNQVNKRKQEIENQLRNIFKEENSVKQVEYSGRMRWSFPCPVTDCGFSTVDLGKHLQKKHKWSKSSIKLQTSYFSNIFNYTTKFNTYNQHKPAICFKCCVVFERLDSHISLKHFSRSTDEFQQMDAAYKKQTEKLLYAVDSFKNNEIHNIGEKIKEITSFKITSLDPLDVGNSKTMAADVPSTSRADVESTSAVDDEYADDILSKGVATSQVRGKFLTPRKSKQRILLKHKQEITKQFRKKYKVETEAFRYFYEDANKVLIDFESYLKHRVGHNENQSQQYRQNVRQIWTSCDPNLAIFPKNYLTNTDLVEDNFYYPLKRSLEINSRLPKEEQTSHIQASTIKSKLCCLTMFSKFLTNRSIFINLTRADLSAIIAKVQELNAALKKSIDQRFKVVSKYKSDHLLTVTDFKSYGSSDHVKEINQLLKNAHDGNLKKIKLNKQRAIDVRDHLMVSLTYFNCLRASNLMNIRLIDVEKITKHKEIDGAYVLTNDEYKVSMIYGSKIILLDEILYQQIQIFIKLFRPLLTADERFPSIKRYLFTSSRIPTNKPLGVKMDHSAIGNALTSTFKKAKVGTNTPWQTKVFFH